MGSGVDVSLDTKELEKYLETWRKRSEDLSPVMAIVAQFLVSEVDEQFETAGGGKWAPLAASTLKKRAAAGKMDGPLKFNGAFAGSIAGDYGPDFAEASTGVPYAVFHVSEAPRKIIPLRNPFDLPDAILDEALDMIVADLTRGM